jgi:hypothetical protein
MRGREVRDDPLLRELEARVLDRRAHPLPSLADGCIAQPDDGEERKAGPDVDLHPHLPRGEAVDGEGADAGEHSATRRYGDTRYTGRTCGDERSAGHRVLAR